MKEIEKLWSSRQGIQELNNHLAKEEAKFSLSPVVCVACGCEFYGNPACYRCPKCNNKVCE